MRVLISGAGIAGTTAAFWLSKLGHDVTVVEWTPILRASGLQIDLRGPGIEVLKRMGLEQAFRAKSAPEQGLQMVDKSGRRWGYFPANKSGQGSQNFTSEFEIMRGDLCRLVYDASAKRAKYVFGTSVQSYKQEEEGVEVCFKNGDTERFDLWVGADGQGSRTRKMMLGPSAPDAFQPLQTNDYVAYFTIPKPIEKGEEYVATIYMATQGRGIMTRRHSPDEMQVYMGYTADEKNRHDAVRGDAQKEKEALADIFEGAGWKSKELIEALKDAGDFYGERMGIVKLDSWSRGRVVLVGDAAYCPTAKTGMGTTSGVVGAYILAGEIGRHCGSDGGKDGLATALKAYEGKFRPFMEQVQKGIAEEKGGGLLMSTALGITLLNCFVGVLSLLRVNVGKYMLREGVKGWDLPEYEEMGRG